jgi:transposase
MAKSRAIAVAEAAKELSVSESTIYKYIKQQGSLEAATAFIKYNRMVGAKKNWKTSSTIGTRYPFLMTKLWRLALGIPDIELEKAI